MYLSLYIYIYIYKIHSVFFLSKCAVFEKGELPGGDDGSAPSGDRGNSHYYRFGFLFIYVYIRLLTYYVNLFSPGDRATSSAPLQRRSRGGY